ncbi:DUF58 domain-containing protein [Gynuella sp.]|uniref:DUF58 domain-containing protein n=1 Tax=Gynuella sp. TaxID=2969146 RepID=UPI003D0C89A7
MLNPLTIIQQFVWQRFNRWLSQRIRPEKQLQMNQKRIYILPSKAGLVLFVLILALLLMAINFQNNLVYMVTFWLLALLVINVLFTYRNLSGLKLVVVRAGSCFAGDRVRFEFDVFNHSNRARQAIQIGWRGQDQVTITLEKGEQRRITLTHDTATRGYLSPGRLEILTHFPTGLAKSWGYMHPDVTAVVFPEPKLALQLDGVHHEGDETEDGQEIKNGSSDFSLIREFRQGDSIKRIHWPAYARTGKLHSREFVDYQHHDQWLDWSNLTLNGTEQKLSHLCARVLEMFEQQKHWGLRIPGTEIAPSLSEQHKIRCLTALATYGLSHER